MDLQVKHGGPAFPAEVDNNTIETVEGFFDEPVAAGERHQYRGMSLRDYFAAEALQGICASGPGSDISNSFIASESYALADAMLAERAK